MKKSFILIFGLALLAGALTFSLLTFYVQPTTVVVAKQDLTSGTRLTADLLAESRIPKGAVPQGAFTSIDKAVGLVLTADRVSGDVITSYVAGDSSTAAGIPAELSPDSVAIAVDVNQATGLAGMLRAGQRVTVIAIIDPQVIQRELSNGLTQTYLPTQIPGAGINGGPQPTSTPTPTPQPPLSPVASITIKGLKVLVVPQSFRYEEVPSSSSQADLFSAARTSQAAQTESVILVEAPLAPVQIAPGLSASPAELLALLDKVATIYLVLEPSSGLTIETASLKAIDLANLYQHITGYELNR